MLVLDWSGKRDSFSAPTKPRVMGVIGMPYVDDARMMMSCHYEAGRLFAMWWTSLPYVSIDAWEACFVLSPILLPSHGERCD